MRDIWGKLKSIVRFAKLRDETIIPEDVLNDWIKSPPIIVLAGINPYGDRKDGYALRVKAIDTALSRINRIYVLCDLPKYRSPQYEQLDENLVLVHVTKNKARSKKTLEKIFSLSRSVYCHSIHNLIHPEIAACLIKFPVKFILDLHGSVPEEFKMERNDAQASRFQEIENFAAKRADQIVVVTRAMEFHWHNKHTSNKTPIILCPIFSEMPAIDVAARIYNERPLVAYAGGTQVWQQIPLMAKLISNLHGKMDFNIMTPDVQLMSKMIKMEGVRVDGSFLKIQSISQTEVVAVLAKADFGFMLRNPDVVNQVACPTKLVEYLAMGVIPIVNTTKIGDFDALGLQSLSAKNFELNQIPNKHRRLEMAQVNRDIYEKLVQQSHIGLKMIVEHSGA
jgi:hypothetical protein